VIYSRSELNKVVESNIENENLMTQLTRHLVLVKFDISLEERKQFIQYWITEKSYAKEDLISKAWIFGIVTDDRELLTDKQRKHIGTWFKKYSNKINALTALAWFPKHLETFGINELSNEIIDKILSKREKNGSWIGNVYRSVRIMYSMSNSNHFNVQKLHTSYSFIEKKLKTGTELNAKISAQILKLLFASDKIGQDVKNYVIESIIEKNKKSLTEEITKILSNDKVGEALELLLDRKNNDSEVVLLMRRLSFVKTSFNNGIIGFEDKNIEKQRIAASILQMIRE